MDPVSEKGKSKDYGKLAWNMLLLFLRTFSNA